MRFAFTLALLIVSTALTLAQEKQPDPRFGVSAKLKAYPQATAKKALGSAIEAIENRDITYLVAHLLDPGFVELRLADRAKQFEAPIEVELARLRDFQIRNPDKVDPADRVPVDRQQFAAEIVKRSRERAFRQLVRDVEDKLLNDPQAVKDLKKFLRDGTFADTETGAKAVHADIKDRTLYFRKIEDRWFLENRHEDAPPPKNPPEELPKKDP